jgi:hypothetical protein
VTVQTRRAVAFGSAAVAYILTLFAALSFLDVWQAHRNYVDFRYGKPVFHQVGFWLGIAAELAAIFFMRKFTRDRSVEGDHRRRFVVAVLLANLIAFLIAVPLTHLVGALAV